MGAQLELWEVEVIVWERKFLKDPLQTLQRAYNIIYYYRP